MLNWLAIMPDTNNFISNLAEHNYPLQLFTCNFLSIISDNAAMVSPSYYRHLIMKECDFIAAFN